jgi:predicted RNA binding protein YcfA (HicA-like mRNA interferase family)
MLISDINIDFITFRLDMKKEKLLSKIMSGMKNTSFNDMVKLVEAYGFHLDTINGSHHIFVHPKISEIVNLQNVKGKAKPYQIKQFLSLIEKYNLQMIS